MITAVHFELTRLMYVFSTNHWRCVPQATAKASCSRQGVHFPISEWIQHEGDGNRLPLKGRLEAFFLYLFCCILHFILLLFSFHTQITSRLTMLTEVGIAAQCNSLIVFLSGSIQMQYQHLAHACHTLPVAFGSHLQVFHTSSFFLWKCSLPVDSLQPINISMESNRSHPPTTTISVWARCWNMRV